MKPYLDCHSLSHTTLLQTSMVFFLGSLSVLCIYCCDYLMGLLPLTLELEVQGSQLEKETCSDPLDPSCFLPQSGIMKGTAMVS